MDAEGQADTSVFPVIKIKIKKIEIFILCGSMIFQIIF